MSETRVRIEGGGEFNEREWLRREVLWASLMAPYPSQMNGWLNGLETAHHLGNSSRKRLYAEYDNDERSQSKAFFNQGKVISGIISSAALFRLNPSNEDLQTIYLDGTEPSQEVLGMQARNVDIAIGKLAVRTIPPIQGDLEAFRESERLAKRAYDLSDFARKRLLLRAGKIMSGLAISEVTAWREMAIQDDEESLPTLTVPNGATPRSAGPRVEKLQPIFHEIVQSEQFQKL
jgi:hypothetical protein